MLSTLGIKKVGNTTDLTEASVKNCELMFRFTGHLVAAIKDVFVSHLHMGKKLWVGMLLLTLLDLLQQWARGNNHCDASPTSWH